MKTLTSMTESGGAVACFADALVGRSAPLQMAETMDPVLDRPAVAAPGGHPALADQVTTIVVGVDADIDADIEDGVAHAIRRVPSGRLRLLLVHARRDLAPVWLHGSAFSAVEPERERHEDYVEAVVAALRSRGLQADLVVRGGQPAAVLADVASECGADLIVIGSRPPKLFQRRVGRVGRALGRIAPCPVVIVAGP